MSFNPIQGGLSIVEVLIDEYGLPVRWQLPATAPFSGQDDTAGELAALLPELEQRWLQSSKQLARGGEPKILGTRVLVSHHWLDVYAFHFAGRDDRKLALLFHDVTEHLETDRISHANEQRLRFAFEQSGVALALNDSNGTFVMTNAVYQRMLGYSAEELKALTWADVTYEDDRPANANSEIELSSRPASHLPYEQRNRRKDGSVIWVRNTVSLVPGTADMPPFAMASVEDITERKRVDSELHAVLQTLEARVKILEARVADEETELKKQREQRERIQDDLRKNQVYMADAERLCHIGISVWLTRTNELFWSDQTFRMFGFDSQDFKPSQDGFLDLIHADDRTAFQEAIEAAIRNDEGYELEFRAVRQDGAIRVMRSIGRPTRDKSGRFTDLIAVMVDITERKQFDESLQTQLAERQRVEAQCRHLLRQVVSAQESERRRIARDLHDHIGQQLTALRIKLFILRSRPEGTTLQSELGPLEEAVRQLDADLGVLTRDLRPAALDDLGLPQAIANFLDNWSKHTGLPAQFDVSGMDHNRLSDDLEIVLYRVTQEALNNVTKHARAMNVAVVLHRNPANVSLIIEDDGIGFEYNHDLIGRESGLGLIGMRERVELTGGTLNIESRPGHGTTIAVRIPISVP